MRSDYTLTKTDSHALHVYAEELRANLWPKVDAE